MNRKSVFNLIFCLAFLSSLLGLKKTYAQQFVYELDYLFYFDNREFHSPYADSQTLLGMRLSPEIGVMLKDSAQGNHRLMAGVAYWQPLSNNFRDAKLMPTIYYQYKIKGFRFYVGAIPFRKMAQPLTELFLSDSLSYLRPNIQGALLQYLGKNGFVEIQCDWFGLQSRTQREAFRLLVDGKFQYKILYLGGMANLTHLANDAEATIREGVCDQSLVNPYVGLDFSKKTPLDSLAIQAGFIYSLSRNRTTQKSIHACGLQADLFLKWKFLGLRNSFYYGKNLFPFYEDFASMLYLGNPHFCATLYNRTDLNIYIVQKSFVDVSFAWRLLFVAGYPLEHQQLLTAHFNLGDKTFSQHKRRRHQILKTP